MADFLDNLEIYISMALTEIPKATRKHYATGNGVLEERALQDMSMLIGEEIRRRVLVQMEERLAAE
jgi:hypothetical protein